MAVHNIWELLNMTPAQLQKGRGRVKKYPKCLYKQYMDFAGRRERGQKLK